MTPAERRALLFLAVAALLGASVRLARTRSEPEPEPAAQRALALQIAAVDSARAAEAEKDRNPRKKSRKASETAPKPPNAPKPRQPTPIPIVDLDEAPIALIDSLPGIGPVIAERIVADRNQNGPFGSLEEFQRVKGIGPAMAQRLSPYVTFSGRSRPNTAHTDGRGPAKNSPRPAGRRRGR
jgi:competence protein ComEA